MVNLLKGHQGIDNHGNFVASPLALLWLLQAGLLETAWFANRND